MKLSARNQIPARVTSINAGEAIANVELDAGGVRLVASVTVEAVGDEWVATVAVTRFSQYVHFRHEGLSATPDWLHIRPSRPRSVRLARASGTVAPDGEVSAINGLNAARYRISL